MDEDKRNMRKSAVIQNAKNNYGLLGTMRFWGAKRPRDDCLTRYLDRVQKLSRQGRMD